ncbi:MAG: ABC transporter permease, partial [Fulvivirga sp.]
MSPTPPHRAIKFLRWFCREDFIEEVEGDLIEVFEMQFDESPKKARRKFYWSVLKYFRPEFIKAFSLNPASSNMNAHNIKLAYRNIFKYKSSYLLNTIGLSIAITTSFLIFNYISFEKSYDNFHINKGSIFRVALDLKNSSEHIRTAQNYSAAGPALKNDFAEVADFVRLYPAISGYNTCTIRHIEDAEDIVFNQKKVYYADNSFFKIFSFPLVYGSTKNALVHPNTCVLSASKSREYFGNTNPIGRTVEISFDGEKGNYKISGVFEDLPHNSHFDIDFLLSYSSIKDDGFQSSWDWNEFYTYILLENDVNSKTLENKLDDFISSYMAEKHEKYGLSEHFVLQPIEDIHLNSNLSFEFTESGDGEMVLLLKWLGVIILVFAWINYLNLSLSLLFKRTREVGVKKVLGAQKSHIVKQIVLEFGVVNLCAIFVSIMLLFLAVPQIGHYLGDTFLHSKIDITFATLYFLAILISTIVFALLPGLLLSSIKPIRVLKGTPRQLFQGLNIRKVFLLVQFAMSIVILAVVLSVFLQIRFLRDEELKMSLDKHVVLHAPNYSYGDTTYAHTYQSFKNELLTHPNIKEISSISTIPGVENNWSLTGVIRRQGTDRKEAKTYYFVESEPNFIEYFNFRLIAGKSFNSQESSNDPTIIINDKSRQELGFSDPESAIGQKIIMEQWDDNFSYSTIIGVIDNYKQEYGKKPILPTIFWTQSGINLNYCLKIETSS